MCVLYPYIESSFSTFAKFVHHPGHHIIINYYWHFIPLIRSLNSLNVRVCESIDVNVSTPIRKISSGQTRWFWSHGMPPKREITLPEIKCVARKQALKKHVQCGGLWEYRHDCKYPNKKKSQVVKSDDFWSHGMSPKREITLLENKYVARKQALINSPLLHWYWNGIYFQGKLSIARHSLASTDPFLPIKKCQALLG